MKTKFREKRSSTFFLALGVLFVFFIGFGCNDDETDPTDVYVIAPLEVTRIIASPKSPSPGDTVLVTASIVSDSLNTGEFPTLSWSSNGSGTFLEKNQLTVRWVAPLASDVYTLTVRAENSVSNSSLSNDLFVGESSMLAANVVEIHATASGDSIYYLTSFTNPTNPLFEGFTISLYIDGTGSSPVTSANPGAEYVFTNDLTAAAHSVLNDLGGFITEHPYNIIYTDLTTQTQTQLTFDLVNPVDLRHTQYTTPAISADGGLVAYEFFYPFPVTGVVDTFDVNMYDIAGMSETNVTALHGRFRKNYYPTISTSGDWLMFMSDRTGQLVWEYYGVPISGGTVPLDSASVVRISDTGGRIGNDLNPEQPMTDWNPNPTVSVLAVGDYQGMLYIVDPDVQSTTQVPLNNRLRDLKWSPNGDYLAASSGANLYIIDYSTGAVGASTVVSEKQASDMIKDIAWSRDSNFLVYRVLRSGEIWYELYDRGGSSGLTEPVIITPASDVNCLEDYEEIIVTRPNWSNSGELFFLLYGDLTPSMYRLDLSGIVN